MGYNRTMVAKPAGESVSRVLILSDQSLFYQGIQNLLEQDAVLDVVDCELSARELVAHIKATRPDAVLLDSDHPPASIASRLMDILHDMRGIRLIGISYQHNTLYVYRGETQNVRDVADLLNVIAERTKIESMAEHHTIKGET